MRAALGRSTSTPAGVQVDGSSISPVSLTRPPYPQSGQPGDARYRHDDPVTEAQPVGTGAEDYDAAHASMHGSLLMHRPWSQAMGDQYPEQVELFSSCSWWLLGQLVAALRLRPGSLRVDLGCGRDGAGLWLAHPGGDASPAAVARPGTAPGRRRRTPP